MVHKGLLEDREPDPSLFRNVPDGQAGECNRYRAFSLGIFRVLGPLSVALEAEVEKLHAFRTKVRDISELLAEAGLRTSGLRPVERTLGLGAM